MISFLTKNTLNEESRYKCETDIDQLCETIRKASASEWHIHLISEKFLFDLSRNVVIFSALIGILVH